MKNKKAIIKRMLSVVMAGTLVLGSFDIPGEVSAVKAADTMENETEEENNSGIQLQAEEKSTAVSGKDGDLDWNIDENGLLTITGSGDYSSRFEPQWCSYADRIKEVKLEVSNITDMGHMFYGCSGLTSLDVSGLDTSKVTDMRRMFYSCGSLTSLDVSGWDTSKVTDMGSIFCNCSSLTSLDVSGWDTSKVTDMECMFSHCSGLTSLNVSGFDTSNVTYMNYMFSDCSGLTSIDISGWNASNINYMDDMFANCSGLTKIIAPANLKLSIDLPTGSWVNEAGESCTTVAAGLAKSMTYTRTDTEETEPAVVIDKVTIADTYYSVDGKLPLYVEYFTAEQLEYSQYQNLELTVTKEDETVVAGGVTNSYYGSENLGNFQFEECAGVEIGKTYTLTFVIKDTSSGKELFKETKEVGFEKKDAWADRAYLPTNQTSYDIHLYIASKAAIEAASSINGICLLDKENQVAADGTANAWTISGDNRYGEIFYQNPYHTGWQYVEISSYSVYRTRKLQAGEVLTVAYSVDGTVIPTDCKVTVTDQPYITSFYETFGTYSGEEYAETVVLQGLHIDFDQVSFVLKDRRTGKEVAHSVSSITTGSTDSACYAVVWSEEYKDKKPVACDIEYHYADKEKQLIAEQENSFYFSERNTENILWNPKTDSIEYHNSELPAGAEVSYRITSSGVVSEEVASGSGITVDSNHHMEVELKETFLSDQRVDLYVSYLDAEGNERTVLDGVWVYQNKEQTGSGDTDAYFIYSSIMNPMFYLSDSECTFSPEVICNDESKLAATGSAVIYDAENQEVGTIELSRES